MLHWPDSMVTYVEPDRVLLSSDAFGQHVASSQRFDREVDRHALLDDAKTYYANILMPFSSLVQNLLAKLPSLNLAPVIIAPDHGLIWTDPGTIVDAYGRWSKFEAKDKIVIVYDTMWESTEKMAHLIARGVIDEGGVEVKVYHLRKSPNSEAINEIQDAKALLVGSSTLNLGLFPTVGGFPVLPEGPEAEEQAGVRLRLLRVGGRRGEGDHGPAEGHGAGAGRAGAGLQVPGDETAGERVHRVRAKARTASQRRQIDEMDVQGLRLHTRRRGAAGRVPHVRRAEAGVQAGALGRDGAVFDGASARAGQTDSRSCDWPTGS